MPSSRTDSLVAHVAAATDFLGPATVAVSLFPRYLLLAIDDPAELGAARAFHRITRAYGTTSLVVPVLGLALAAQGGYLDELWVGASIGLFAVLAVLVLGVVVPGQRRLLDGGDDGVGVARLRTVSGLAPLAWLAILVLMIATPA